MKLNPAKCMFGVKGEKFLGYLVIERGIEVNPEKVRLIMEMKSPIMVKEVQQLSVRIASLGHFLSKSANRNLSFFLTLRKIKNFEWMLEFENTFQQLKEYFVTTPPSMLAKPFAKEALLLWL
ncbi:hypothetical protein Sango_1182100 [Sesamum angolense]|uniref:Retrovirus-related Pol polyprotein from transposon 17.6 n=1 Tax=Sesamum angolense TaxID=2727404 RepID=A0AAE2BX68_9LAMI|nr:hypothetical protein Sango_1182100 [Sesamum angolense]